MATYSQLFDSVSDFLTHLDSVQTAPRSSDKACKNDGFHEFKDMEACKQALRAGWQEGVDAVNAQTLAIERIVGASVLRETYAPETTGLFFDVGLVLTGEPECWLQTVDEDTGSKVVTVSINACISGAVDKRVIIKRGAAVCALVKLLESQGKSVRVVYGMGLNVNFERTGDKLQLSVTLKREGETLDIDTLAFWLVCPDAFRRLCFRYIEGHPQIWPQVGIGYGYPDTDWVPEADVAVHAISSAVDWTDEQAQEWIKKTMRAQGINVE
jgi:hypothetical protein